jgi:DNA-binding transcriptional LysR family regulator
MRIILTKSHDTPSDPDSRVKRWAYLLNAYSPLGVESPIGIGYESLHPEGTNLMNVSQLRTFVTVVDTGSFSEAARVLEISQPAVTMQMQSLEASLGTTLVDRRHRGVDLTEAGRTLLPHAKAILDEIVVATGEVAALSGTVSGHLVIAASTTPGVYVIPRLLGSFLAEYPLVSATIAIHDSSEVVDAVEAGTVQLGITGATVRGARARFDRLGSDDLVLICPPDHPFADRERISTEDLAGATWILREQGSGTRQVTEKVLTGIGLDPSALQVAAEFGAGEAIVSAVEGGMGVSVISRFVAEKAIALKTVVQVVSEGFPAPRPFYVVLPKGTPTRAAEAFADHLARSLRS